MMRLHLPYRWAIPVALVALAACGGDDLTLPSDGSPADGAPSPAELQMAGGDGQVGVAGSPLPSPVRVQVLDDSGNGLAGQSVNWIVSTGGGRAPQSTTTDANGYAEATWVLGAPGANSLSAAVAGVGQVTFVAMANDTSNGSGNGGSGGNGGNGGNGGSGGNGGTGGGSGSGGNGGGGSGTGTVPSSAASTVSADPASLPVGSTATIRVTVRDAAGLPVPGAVVTLSASGSGNTLKQPSQPTGNDGVAVGTLKSTIAGTKDIMATVNGTTAITQTAQVFVTPAPASRIAAVEGNNQSARTGEQVSVPPAVRVTNSLGEPVPGVGVTFVVTRGGGSVTGESQITDPNGVARVGSWTLGSSAGQNRLEARAGSLNGSPVVFSATATAPQQPPPPPPPPPPPSTAQVDHFQFRVLPHDVRVNEWFTVEVAMLDKAGKIVPVDGTQIYLGLWPAGSNVPDNTRLAGDRFVDTRNGVAVFNLYVKKSGTYRFTARSDFLPKNLGPFGPELFSDNFQVH
jgi:hypothetical protein